MTAQAIFRAATADDVSGDIAMLIGRVRGSVVQVHRHGQGGAAGFIWRSNGQIITNDHVIAGARDLLVRLPDGRELPAQVLARVSSLDLALLAIQADNLAALPMGDSEHLRVGQMVFAIGHPWGYPDVVTSGIISGLARPIDSSVQTARFIQTDVRLAPGNSGGPLLDAQGHVIGVNAMIFGGDLAIAIPIHIVRDWLAQGPDMM